MKRAFCLILLFLTTNILFAQSENYKTAMHHFLQNYNAADDDKIFRSFSSEMQKALPLENAKQFLAGIRAQFGKIKAYDFVRYEQGTYACYKTKFEKAVMAVNISLDHQAKINGLFIKPYQAQTNHEVKAVNALSSYPKEIGDAIFSKSKVFPNNTQLSISIIKNRSASFYGVIRENDTLKTIRNENKVFEIGSISKVFTASVLAALVVDKKLKLSDYIHIYYPFPFKDNIKITFQSLANHTSGLPGLPGNFDFSNEINPYKNYGKAQLDAYLKKDLKIEKWNTYAYSNLGAGLLGSTLGLTQKKSFEALVQEEVFDKYRMYNSYTSAANLQNSLVKGLNPSGVLTSNWDFDVLLGAGGILSTTADLAKFASAQFNDANQALALTRTPTFQVNDQMKMGLGWHILKAKNNQALYWHNGGTGGYASSMLINTTDKIAVIILSNVSGFNPDMENIDALTMELLNQMHAQ